MYFFCLFQCPCSPSVDIRPQSVDKSSLVFSVRNFPCVPCAPWFNLGFPLFVIFRSFRQSRAGFRLSSQRAQSGAGTKHKDLLSADGTGWTRIRPGTDEDRGRRRLTTEHTEHTERGRRPEAKLVIPNFSASVLVPICENPPPICG